MTVAQNSNVAIHQRSFGIGLFSATYIFSVFPDSEGSLRIGLPYS